ncbi:hypothetical protein [Streptococcus hyointestinalis]|uniref:hypothetical protein n=1 Tax=Streptococcus hyointestinalis TaxID=1337 RepID=UPI0013E0678D|nr:hypothetical protein [Streptococcus hyointestinalis]
MKKQTILKSLFFTLITLFVLFLVGFIYISYNLATYQLYYAKHMPHAKGTNPEMAVILDGLDFSEEPEIKGIRYNIDGNNSIIKDNSVAVRQTYEDNGGRYEVSIIWGRKGEQYSYYLFSSSGKFISYFYKKIGGHKDLSDSSEQRRKEAQGYVDEIIKPVAAKLEKQPKVNLQWLFNKKYEKRFSR